jgi:urea transporter
MLIEMPEVDAGGNEAIDERKNRSSRVHVDPAESDGATGEDDTLLETPRWAQDFADKIVSRLSEDRLSPARSRIADLITDQPSQFQFTLGGEAEQVFNPLSRAPTYDPEYDIRPSARSRPLLDSGFSIAWFFKGFVCGDAPAAARFARAHSWALFILDVTLRGVGQVVFCNNPITGLVIMIALASAHVPIAAFGFIGVLASTIFGHLVLSEPPHTQVSKGLFGYNGLLVGLAMATFANELNPMLVLPVLSISILSAILFVAISKWLQVYNVSALTLPFNVACLVWFSFTIQSYLHNTTIEPSPTAPLPSPSAADSHHTEAIYAKWWMIFPRGVAQIFLCSSYKAGIGMIVGIALCSPTSAAMCMYGSVVGSCVAIGLGVDDSQVEKGLYVRRPIYTPGYLHLYLDIIM